MGDPGEGDGKTNTDEKIDRRKSAAARGSRSERVEVVVNKNDNKKVPSLKNYDVVFWEHLFKKYDEDDSGTIQKKELSDILESLNVHIKAGELNFLMKEIDQDGSGELDFEEFMVFFGKVDEINEIKHEAQKQIKRGDIKKTVISVFGAFSFIGLSVVCITALTQVESTGQVSSQTSTMLYIFGAAFIFIFGFVIICPLFFIQVRKHDAPEKAKNMSLAAIKWFNEHRKLSPEPEPTFVPKMRPPPSKTSFSYRPSVPESVVDDLEQTQMTLQNGTFMNGTSRDLNSTRMTLMSQKSEREPALPIHDLEGKHFNELVGALAKERSHSSICKETFYEPQLRNALPRYNENAYAAAHCLQERDSPGDSQHNFHCFNAWSHKIHSQANSVPGTRPGTSGNAPENSGSPAPMYALPYDDTTRDNPYYADCQVVAIN